MEKKVVISLILISIFIMLAGCQEDNTKIDYQTFYSNDVSILQGLDENLTKENIDDIAHLGEALAFQLQYPLNWETEYNLFSNGLFSVIFFPEKAESNYSKSITVDLIFVQPNTTIPKMKSLFHNTYIESTETEFNLNEDLYVWKITGKREDTIDEEYNDFNQGTAFIMYNKSEIYKIETFFKDSESSNMKIFNNMINSFDKIG